MTDGQRKLPKVMILLRDKMLGGINAEITYL